MARGRSAPTLILVLVLVLLPGLPAAGQEGRAEEPINVSAIDQEFDGRLWRAAGDVVIRYQDITVRCDRMEYDRDTTALDAWGHVTLDQGPRRFSASELHFDLDTKTGTMLEASGSLPPTYHFEGAVIEKLDETRYRLQDATFTSCEPQPRPPWAFHVRSAILEEDGYGYFHGAALRVKGAPILYLPYMVWPLKRERTMGLLMPSFGYSQRRGAYLGNSLFIPIGRSLDTTVYLDGYSRGYLGLGSEWRWAPGPDARGEITAYTIYDQEAERWEWKVTGRHSQDDFHGFRLLAEVEDLSDVDFFQEFERSFDRNTLRSLYSYVYLTRSWGPAALNLRLDRRITFTTSQEIEQLQLPEAELRVRSTRIGRTSLYWSLISSVNLLAVDRGGELRGAYGRADLFPTLSYTLPGPPWLSVTPRAGARTTHYSSRYTEELTDFENSWEDRSYITAGVDIVGPSISRVFDRPVGPFKRFKHLVEPRIEYEYLSDPGDTSRIPLFDEVDRTPVTNRARFTLANRLFARSRKGVGATELASLEISQEYSFSDPLSRSVAEDSQWGPLSASLRVTPSRGLSFDTRASWDTIYDSLMATSVATSVSRWGTFLNLTWYQSYIPSSGERSSSQVRSTFGYRDPESPVNLTIQLGYDLEQQEFQQQVVRLGYRGSCWGATAEYRDLRIGAYPTRDYRLVITLAGVGRLPEIQGSLGTAGMP